MNAQPYADSHELLAHELERLDLLLAKRIERLRCEPTATPEETATHHLYITDAEVDRLLARRACMTSAFDAGQSEIDALAISNEINARIAASEACGVYLSLVHLQRVFGLSSFERMLTVVCLAPELDRKYDRLFAYLQDDITRKRPSFDLILNLVAVTTRDRWRLRGLLSSSAPVFRVGLIETVEDPQSPSGASDLARFLQLNRRCLDFLLEQNMPDERIDGLARISTLDATAASLWMDSEVYTRIKTAIRRQFEDPASRPGLLVYLQGPSGVGKQRLAHVLCDELQLPLLVIDGAALVMSNEACRERLRIAFRESVLQGAGILVNQIDTVVAAEGRVLTDIARIAREFATLTFLAGTEPWRHSTNIDNPVICAELSIPDAAMRETVWRAELSKLPNAELETDAARLAARFRLTPGQIAAAAERTRLWQSDDPAAAALSIDSYARAARELSRAELHELAVNVDPRYRWRDLILPSDRLETLHEICNQVAARDQVFGQWGFDRKLSHGKGLSVLFAGPPGTGKTMAAEVIAGDLGLDLYKVDLSGIVSKYIGETEKNLARIFRQAESSNAILFFDEADALFGKRTEIADAHDRYANIETSYLLQKMEEYEGVVILASNLRQNMDDAFQRRLRFIVQFPFPQPACRFDIWRAHFPAEAPCASDIDFELLAQRFQVAGGNIKNIVLNAAFLAAGENAAIGMPQLLRGARREYEKIGKLWNNSLEAIP